MVSESVPAPDSLQQQIDALARRLEQSEKEHRAVREENRALREKSKRDDATIQRLERQFQEVRRRLEQFVGRPAANRLHPLLSRVVTSGARSPIAITAWRAGNRVLHRHRRVVRLGRLPRVATGPVMVMTAIAGKVAGITSRGTGARGPITSPR